jgi:hypothetical protein
VTNASFARPLRMTAICCGEDRRSAYKFELTPLAFSEYQ